VRDGGVIGVRIGGGMRIKEGVKVEFHREFGTR
jgi:hypothetical protein